MSRPPGPVFDAGWRHRSTVRVISLADAMPMILRHYLGRRPGVVLLSLGLFIDGEMRGVCIFADAPKQASTRYGGKTIELARLFIEDGVPTNAESFFMAAGLREAKRRLPKVYWVITYADPSVGHTGAIYRASNWFPDGHTDDYRASARFDYVDAATGKVYARAGHVPRGAVIERRPRVSKARFAYRLRSA